MKITVSIGVIFFHGEKFWSHFGQSITEQTFRNFELLVFENSLPKINLKKNLPFGLKKKTNFFRTKRNLSFAAAHNFLIKKSRGQFYFCVNQDLIFHKIFRSKIYDNIFCTRFSVVFAFENLRRNFRKTR